MKLLFINIKGGGNFAKIVTVINFVLNTKADIIFFCETHFTPDKLERYRRNWPLLTWYSNSPYSNQSGIACIVRDTTRTPLSTTRIVDMDTEGRILGIELRTDGGKLVRILGIYAPNEETQSVTFFKQLNERGLKGYHIVIGDMNKCEAKLDRNPSRTEDLRVVEAFQLAFENNGFIDGWRLSNPDARVYTYWSNNQLCSASRIDRIYVSMKTFRKCAKWEIINTPKWSDHNAISVEYYPHDRIKFGPGIWRMNTPLLQRADVRQGISIIMRDNLQPIQSMMQRLSDPNKAIVKLCASEIVLYFDQMMLAIRAFTMHYQNNLAKKRNKLTLKLEQRLNKYDGKERNRKYARRIKHTRIRLKALLEERAQKQSIFSYAKKLEAGGYQSEFWKLGKDPHAHHTVAALYDKNGKLQKQPDKVLHVAEQFYKELYSERHTDILAQDRLLENIIWDSELDISFLATREEVLEIITKWKTGSTPGPS
ncbi:putative 149 kDa protein, partial [Erysiphe neolycopersici]